MKHLEGTKRVIIDHVKPEINCGQFPIKRVVGEKVVVQADVFTDGHDTVRALLLYRQAGKKNWQEKPMDFLGNDRWESEFVPTTMGMYEYTVAGWVDHFLFWQTGLKKKYEAHQDIAVELLIGAELLEQTAAHTKGGVNKKLLKWASALRQPKNMAEAVALATGPEVSELMYEYADRSFSRQYPKILQVSVERQKALFSSWYEFFPRSTSQEYGQHGTFRDCERILPRVAEMGFDVVYLPPIHPIGMAFRKGYNNAVTAEPGNPGSPWAIGGEAGGHKDIHPELGTLEDFHSLVRRANELGIEIALDFAIQCSPDHPYVKAHPQWFKWRPDGTVQYAENPPKKYQDVLPVNFETEDWVNLWQELKSIVVYWIKQGVNIFRVDNPHTKPFPFWEWLIKEVRAVYPNTIFLAEAFTRPRIMERLGKLGYTQSYTYFTWRETAEELQQYMEELTKTDMREYYRPNFWPNTPDILPIHLQQGGEPMFLSRVILAATMSSNYGLYGPVYEFGINAPMAPGKEEYLDSEKYEIKRWDWDQHTRIRDVITKLNHIRKENPALQTTWHIEFAKTDNPNIICYAKTDQDMTNRMIIAVNLDPHNRQAGWVQVPVKELWLDPEEPYLVYDLLSGHTYTWRHEWNYVELHPDQIPAHVFRIEGPLLRPEKAAGENKPVH
jgi:starch synthase (maltosyl-transferring)